MQRRQFLKITGQLGAGLGTAVPFLNPLDAAALVKTGAQANRVSAVQELIMPLDEGWSMAIDPENVGRSAAWFQSPQANAKATRIPSIIQQSYPKYHGVAWYWLEFEPQRNPWKEGRYLLRFHAVDYLADVWLNGAHVGMHEGGETPFALDVTETIRPEQSNRLAVRVLNPDDTAIDGILLLETPHHNKVVNYSNGMTFDYGGIIASVELLFVPAFHLSDIYVRADWKTGDIRLEAEVTNESSKPVSARLHFTVTQDVLGDADSIDTITLDVPTGTTIAHHEMSIKKHQLWDLDNPWLYRLHLRIESDALEGSHAITTAFGFRDFRLVNGYFHLNGKRLFLRCTHGGNHVPFGVVIPPDGYTDLLRRDLLYAKASGFNTVRFLAGVAYPYQLDLCDELGLMVYEESQGSWLLKDSPQMKRRYENSVREMIIRDRNHPSLTIWGLLNETEDGPVFREAVGALPLVRSLDSTRLVLLSSGRFDGHLDIGSTSNPDSSSWEYVWGKEEAGMASVAMKYPSGLGSGDFHLYPNVPQTQETNQMMRDLGKGSKPVFLSEYGIGSMMNVIHELRMYEQADIPEDAEDFVLVRYMADHFTADWSRFGMDVVYPYPETLLEMSQKKMGQHRLLGFNLIRSNPNICGFNLTGMLDHALVGEGVWRFWRDWKPGIFDVMRDGWAPVRWCLFVEPTHTYAGRPITLEAVLANEDVLQAGNYSATFRVWGPKGMAWDKQAVISIPDKAAENPPLAIPVMKESATIHGPAGSYKLIPSIQKGVAPPETSCRFYISDPASLPHLHQDVVTLGIPRDVETWLNAHGVASVSFTSAAPLQKHKVILVGDIPQNQSTASQWTSLARDIATGSTVIFLSPLAFAREKENAAWLPLTKKGRIYKFSDFLYHKECVAKPHPVFEGIEANGILDWYYFGSVLPSYVFDGQDTPDEVIAAAFAAGYTAPGGYASGVLLGKYSFHAGAFIVNSFPMLEHIDQHPVADRMLLNLIQYAGTLPKGEAVALPSDWDDQLKKIGYMD
ncbi:glycoside hydrolase family 2 protein [Acidobacterium sp. S8]|uniref:glycoside hydrolase family 2 protein n=1 Tax=Acidobacterium sp. S8 TaxID=1641854 RepID=UPI00131D32E6|nr:sugar-binding domain-containing protein [Acidobacterium sp. S8]